MWAVGVVGRSYPKPKLDGNENEGVCFGWVWKAECGGVGRRVGGFSYWDPFENDLKMFNFERSAAFRRCGSREAKSKEV